MGKRPRPRVKLIRKRMRAKPSRRKTLAAKRKPRSSRMLPGAFRPEMNAGITATNPARAGLVPHVSGSGPWGEDE